MDHIPRRDIPVNPPDVPVQGDVTELVATPAMSSDTLASTAFLVSLVSFILAIVALTLSIIAVA